MRQIYAQTALTLALVFTGMLVTGPSLADKPAWAGGEKSSKHQQNREEQQGGEHGTAREMGAEKHFDDRQRAIIRDYYAGQFRAGHCPPGLAKKNTGCLPPGQAKKWTIGQALPRDVAYDDLPPRVAAQLGTPPAGHRYVRVASDILMIAVGTGMVVDAIEDLGKQ